MASATATATVTVPSTVVVEVPVFKSQVTYLDSITSGNTLPEELTTFLKSQALERGYLVIDLSLVQRVNDSAYCGTAEQTIFQALQTCLPSGLEEVRVAFVTAPAWSRNKSGYKFAFFDTVEDACKDGGIWTLVKRAICRCPHCHKPLGS